ncbi:MAG: acetate--CoA ligase family protein [Desulfohalobiaceae bacterium]|nr:acetate--CoA ligase family protein [Desulfohalobiaceae bacterium]
MPPDLGDAIEQALTAGSRSLDESESKTFLREFTIPVIPERTAASAEEAVRAAEEIGYPVVLKGLARDIGHKTEAGLVRLGLEHSGAVRHAFQEMEGTPGLRGVLVQPQIKAEREFLAGFFRDPQFGPVLMFGLGGIFTEALSDVSLRLAPVTEQDARDMLAQIRSRSLLQGVRNQRPADEAALVRTLTGLGELARDYPDIRELDINPLLITAEGEVLAADALAVLERGQSLPGSRPAISPRTTEEFFRPRSLVFIGASSRLGKWGHLLVTNVTSGRFPGAVYLVNPKGGTIAGQEAYTSLDSLPETPDLAVVTIPAAKISGLLEDLRHKGITRMVLIASGFAETGPQGRELEHELVDKANRLGITILGPNTMGLCNPHHSFYCTGSIVQPRPGSTAMISQSGNMGVQLLSFAEQQGIGIRSFCGSGNEAMLSVEDFLDYLAEDELTRTVMLYLESPKDGHRFLDTARRASRKKPIVLLKGGSTKQGSKAAASHTGAMSSDNAVFDGLCRQAGVIRVDGPMDLLDLTAAFSSLPLPQGRRVAVVTLGGGWGVITADMCAQYGLVLPELSQEVLSFMDAELPPYWSRSNPVDLVGESDLSLPLKAMEKLAAWDGCDAVINLGILGRRAFVQDYLNAVRRVDPGYSEEYLQDVDRELARFEQEYVEAVACLMETHEKPIFGVRLQSGESDRTIEEASGSRYQSVFFHTPEKAVKACAMMYRYNCFLCGTCET